MTRLPSILHARKARLYGVLRATNQHSGTVLTIATLLIFSLTTMFLWSSYVQIESDYKDLARSTAERLSKSVSIPLSSFDKQQVEALVTAEAVHRPIDGIVINDTTLKQNRPSELISFFRIDKELVRKKPKNINFISEWLMHSEPISHSGKKIGTVTVYIAVEQLLPKMYALAGVAILVAIAFWITCVILSFCLSALFRALDEAEAAITTKSLFLANMSHELRTPLNGVIGLIHVLRDSNLDSEQRELIETIGRSAQSLLMIINDILDISKIEAGKLALSIRPIEVGKLVSNVVSELTSMANEKGVSLEGNTVGKFEGLVKGDDLRIKQVLYNLVGNAIKFTDAGGSVTVSALYELDNADERVNVLICVSDTGIGISKDVQRKLFDNFTQGDATISRRFGGTGLGLSICSKLVQMMNGKLWLESTEGEGSNFFLALSLEPASCNVELPTPKRYTVLFKNSSNTEQTSSTQKKATNEVLTGSGKILLVEDNPVNELVARKILEKAGYQVRWAKDGTEALRMSEQEEFHLVLMDIQMPIMDGFEATKEIRLRETNSPTPLPIVGLSANTSDEVKNSCSKTGMNAFITKPFLPQELLATVKKHVKSDV